MTPRITLAVAARVLTQLRRDHRTLAMLLVLPCLLIIAAVVDVRRAAAGRRSTGSGPALLAMFPFIVMFLVTSVTTLRERSERHPRAAARDADGQARLPARLRARVRPGRRRPVGARGRGQRRAARPRRRRARSGCSAWSRSPTPSSAPRSACSSARSRAPSSRPSSSCRLIVLPQILLCGLFVPRDALPDVLEAVSDVLPLSYAVDAMQHLTAARRTGEVWPDLAVVAAFALGGLALGAATLRRRTP